MESGAHIRSISRCIAVLKVINRHGSLSLMDVARTSNLPYPTAYRIVQTLIHEGLIECEPSRKRYRATATVQTLSQGFDNEDELVVCGRPHLVALTKEVGWPLEVTTRIGVSMILRDSSHYLTSLTLALRQPGLTMPLAACAEGRVYLAYASDEERQELGEALWPGRAPPAGLSADALAAIRTAGFAADESSSHGGEPGETSSISVPICRDGGVAGVMTLVVLTSLITLHDACDRYVGKLQATARLIGDSLDAVAAEAIAFSAGESRALQ